MKIALFSPDSKIPNLAIMKLSSYHKSKGHEVDFLSKMTKPDEIYVSVIFKKNSDRFNALHYFYPDSKIFYGGSGLNYDRLPDHIEHIMPDYSLYGENYSMGFTTRGCCRKCSFCIVRDKEGSLRFNASLKEFVHPTHKNLLLMDNNLLGYKKHLDILKDIKERDLKVDFNQGLDIRLINKENAKSLSELKYYNHHFDKRTLRFSFDNSNTTAELIKGFNLLKDAGIKPRDLFFYILAYPDNVEDAVERIKIIHGMGSRPFVMRFNQAKTKQLVKLSRWVNHLPYYEIFSFDEFKG